MPSQRAYRFLEQLQAEAYRASGEDPEWSLDTIDLGLINRVARSMSAADAPDSQVEDIVQYFLASYEGEIKSAPTKYENPLARPILTGLQAQLSGAGERLNITPWPDPAIGTLPTGQVNAITLALPGGERDYIVAFESGLFTFALLLSKAVVQALPYKIQENGGVSFSFGQEDVSRIIGANPDVSRRFTEALLAYVIYGRPGYAPQYVLEDRYHGVLAQMLREALELFVLGHEYGHIILDHVNSAERRASALPASDGETSDGLPEELIYGWIQEIQADRAGAALTVAAVQIKGLDASLGFWGADLFFSAMDIMDKSVSLLQFGDEERVQLGSHPPHTVRRRFLRQALVEDAGGEAAKGPIDLGEQVERIVSELWVLARPEILRMHADGVRPARRWLSSVDGEVS